MSRCENSGNNINNNYQGNYNNYQYHQTFPSSSTGKNLSQASLKKVPLISPPMLSSRSIENRVPSPLALDQRRNSDLAVMRALMVHLRRVEMMMMMMMTMYTDHYDAHKLMIKYDDDDDVY